MRNKTDCYCEFCQLDISGMSVGNIRRHYLDDWERCRQEADIFDEKAKFGFKVMLVLISFAVIAMIIGTIVPLIF